MRRRDVYFLVFWIGWMCITSTFVIEYYGLVPADVWDRYLFNIGRYIPFLYFKLAPTTILGLILIFLSVILLYIKG